jgi:peptide/nickel transport system permease protein
MSEVALPDFALAGDEPISVWRLRWRRLKRDRVALASGVVLIVLFAASYSAALVESWLGASGVEPDLLSRLDPPSVMHLLGADEIGRDELARLLRGGQTSLAIGLLGAMGASLIGTLIGAVSGYFRGRTDMVLMRFTDFVIAVPHLPILIILAALDLSKLGFTQEFIRSGAAGYWRIVIIVTLLGWTGVARLVRASTLALAEREFVLAARAQGAAAWWIVFVHIVPNAITPVIVATTIAMGRVILAESGLSFLGLGIRPPATSWGSMLSNAQDLIGSAPMLAILPGALIMVTVIAINFLGDGLQAAFDPRSDRR